MLSGLYAVMPPLAQADPMAATNPLTEGLLARVMESGVVLSVLLLLIGMSLASWIIIAYKVQFFRRIRKDSTRFLEIFWKSASLDDVLRESKQLDEAPIAQVFQGGYAELSRLQAQKSPQTQKENPGRAARLDASRFENVERALNRAQQHEMANMEQLTQFLATTGSAAPCIGLFGTVWGIMEAFAQIRPEQNLLLSVAPHIAEALVATAIGLLAAIPAVIGYNFFVRKIRLQTIEMDNFATDFLNIVRRNFF